MSRTIAEMIINVSDSLGDRSGGKIGSRSVAEVVTSQVNNCLLKIAKCKKHIAAFEKNVSITLVSGTYQYAIPTTDISSAPIRVKKFLQWVCYKSGETVGYPVYQLIASRRDQLFPLTNTTHTSRPYYYSIFGSQIEVYPMPDATYYMKGRAIVWPTIVTASSSSTGIGEEFDDVIEEYATAQCYLILQQVDDAKLWFGLYKDNLAKTLASLDDYPDHEWFPAGSTDMIGNMSLQPVSINGNNYRSNLLGVPPDSAI